MSAVKNIRVCCVLVVLSVSLWVVPASFAGEVIDAQELYRRAVSGVVLIVTHDDSLGTGWVLDRRQKLIVTNNHVINTDDNPMVYFPAVRNGRVIAEPSYYAKRKTFVVGHVVMKDAGHDLAIIRLDSMPDWATELPLAPVPANPGQRVHVIGQPGASGAFWVYSTGCVRQIYTRPEKNREPALQIVETTVPVNPGDSGSPTLDDEGRVVGVTEAHRVASQGEAPINLVSFSIDVREVRDLRQRYILQQQTAALRSPFGRLPVPAVR